MEKLILLDLLFLHLCKEKGHSLTPLTLLPVPKLLFPAPFVGTGAFDSCPMARAGLTWHKDPGAEITGVQQGRRRAPSVWDQEMHPQRPKAAPADRSLSLSCQHNCFSKA